MANDRVEAAVNVLLGEAVIALGHAPSPLLQRIGIFGGIGHSSLSARDSMIRLQKLALSAMLKAPPREGGRLCLTRREAVYMSVTIKSLNTNMYFKKKGEECQAFCDRERNAWEAILGGIIKPKDAETETVLVLHEVSGPGVDKELSDKIGRDLDSAGFDCIEGFQTPYQLLKTMVIARPGLISEIPDIPQEFTDDEDGLKNRYVPFVIHDEARDINALAVHAPLGAKPTPAAQVARKLALLESHGVKYDIIAGDFNSGRELSPNCTPKIIDDYESLLGGHNFNDAANGALTYSPLGTRDGALTSVDHILVGRGLTVREDIKDSVVFIQEYKKFKVEGHIFDHALIKAVVSVKR